LKPDAYRRVEGRLPSPRIQGRLQKPLWFQQRGMAPPFSSPPAPSSDPKIEIQESIETTVVYLVRSLGLLPEIEFSRLARST